MTIHRQKYSPLGYQSCHIKIKKFAILAKARTGLIAAGLLVINIGVYHTLNTFSRKFGVLRKEFT